jgi:molybdopterin converting factor small subunit
MQGLRGNEGMSALIAMHPFFAEHDRGKETIEVEAKSVEECLAELVRQYPPSEKKLFEKKGTLRGYLEIYVNGKSTFPKELLHPIVDGDEIRIIVFGAGG